MDLGRGESREDLGGARGNHNHNILYEKNIFNKKNILFSSFKIEIRKLVIICPDVCFCSCIVS